jgi:hypothetical protein
MKAKPIIHDGMGGIGMAYGTVDVYKAVEIGDC